MNITEVEKKCVGCGACVDICPTRALSLKHNEYGFYEATLSDETCINCGKCLKVCPALDVKAEARERVCYYGWTKDEETRKNSSSGGAFSALAQQILSEGGVVFGARYAEDFRSVIMSSTEECTLDELRRSKYCQSVFDGMYAKIQEKLKEEKKVMLVGTPCQIAAARKLFGEEDNLLLVDFLCGGVSPDTAFSEYVAYLEKKYKSKIKNINMRDKSSGWSNPRIRINFENGKVYSKRYQLDFYYHYFYSSYMKNEPCITCAFTEHQDADITIADFWGYKNARVSNDDKGISLICTYTEKGKQHVDHIREKMTLHSLDKKHTDYAFKEKKHSAKALSERERFMKLMKDTSFIEAAKKHHFKYGELGVLVKILLRKVVRK